MRRFFDSVRSEIVPDNLSILHDKCEQERGELGHTAQSFGNLFAGASNFLQCCENPAQPLMKARTFLPARIRWDHVVGAVIDHELAVVLAAVLDCEHPQIRIAHELFSPFRSLVQSCIALLLNHAGSVGDGLLNELDYVGFCLEGLARGIVAFAKIGIDVGAGGPARHDILEGSLMKKIFGEGAPSFCSLKSYLSSGKSLAMAMSLLPMSFHRSSISSVRDWTERGG